MPLRSTCKRRSWQRACCRLVITTIAFALLLATSPHRSSAQSVTLDSLRALPVLGVYHLNPDCYPDTVLGGRTTHGGFAVRAILWGKQRAGSTAPAQDTLSACFGPIPHHKRLSFTLIEQPAWNDIAVSTAFERLNNDTLPDLVFYMRGRVPKGSGPNATEAKARRMVVFSQNGLDTLPVLHLGEVAASFQFTPFFAMDLLPDAHLRERAARDLSGRASYVLHGITFDVERTEHREVYPTGHAPEAAALHVYPNPAAMTADVAATPIDDGEYTVEVVATSGAVEIRRDVQVTAGSLTKTLDVSHLANGYYLVRLVRDGRVAATYPIVVTR